MEREWKEIVRVLQIYSTINKLILFVYSEHCVSLYEVGDGCD